MMHDVKMGRRVRKSFSHVNEVLSMPDLIEVQKNSYYRFLKEDLREVFNDISPIVDYSGKLVLEFVDYRIDLDKPKYSQEESKERDVNYAAPLRVSVRLINKETGEVKQQEVFMGDFPLMTPQGTFIINGAERVIVSQLVRSPGAYYSVVTDKWGNQLYSSQVIPNRGAWLEYETDSNGILYVKIDRQRKVFISSLLRAIGYGTNAEIIELLGDDERLQNTLAKDPNKTVADGLIEIYKRQRPGEPPTEESARNLLNSLFFDNRYDLARVGRYKFNKKLGIKARIAGCVADELLLEGKARAARRIHDLAACQRRTEDGAHARDLIFHLDELAAVFRQQARHRLRDLRGRRDRIAGEEVDASRDCTFCAGLIALHQSRFAHCAASLTLSTKIA